MNSVMQKTSELASNLSTSSSQRIRFRSMTGAQVLALALFLVISALSAAFLLFQ
jgi:hypothetical protein